jgi:class 3 adenylate cyclase
MESMGEESLLGPEVNFVFRMEKLAGSLGIACLLSMVCREKLGALVETKPVGRHEVKGFDGEHEFCRWDPA